MHRLRNRLTEVVIKTRDEEESKFAYTVDAKDMPTKKTGIINYKLYTPYCCEKDEKEKRLKRSLSPIEIR